MASDSTPMSTAASGAGSPARTPAADVELVLKMQSGDERALGAFYDRWYPAVSALVARMLKSADDVEDVVEETFWQAWRQASRFAAERGSVATWLLTIARSRALDRLRATRRLREETLEETRGDAQTGETGAAAVVAAPNDPSRDVEQNERRTLVLAALQELPREQREALELGYFGGLSQSEIAERTGQPLGTIKTRMRLAMLKLRERLAVLRDDAPAPAGGGAR